MNPVAVVFYRTSSGVSPCWVWLDALDDRQGKFIIDSRINRLRHGLFGNVRRIGEGVHEVKIDYGPGYRVYFIQDGPAVVILLCGGVKKSQAQDIVRAKEY